MALFFKSKVLFPLDALLFCLAGLMIFFGLANYVSVCRNWLLYDSNHWLLYLSPVAIFVHLCTLNYQFKVVTEQIHIHLEYHFTRVSLDSWYSNHWLYCYFRISKSLKHHLLLKTRCIQMEGVNGTHRRKYSGQQFKADEVTLMLAS